MNVDTVSRVDGQEMEGHEATAPAKLREPDEAGAGSPEESDSDSDRFDSTDHAAGKGMTSALMEEQVYQQPRGDYKTAETGLSASATPHEASQHRARRRLASKEVPLLRRPLALAESERLEGRWVKDEHKATEWLSLFYGQSSDSPRYWALSLSQIW